MWLAHSPGKVGAPIIKSDHKCLKSKGLGRTFGDLFTGRLTVHFEAFPGEPLEACGATSVHVTEGHPEAERIFPLKFPKI